MPWLQVFETLAIHRIIAHAFTARLLASFTFGPACFPPKRKIRMLLKVLKVDEEINRHAQCASRQFLCMKTWEEGSTHNQDHMHLDIEDSILCISKDVWGVTWIKMNHDIYYRMSIPTLEYPSLDRSAIVSTRPRTRAADLIISMHGISLLQPLKGFLQKGPFTIFTIIYNYQL